MKKRAYALVASTIHWVFLILGFGLLMMSVLCLLAALLGMTGILADVSLNENFDMGMKALRAGLASGLASAVILFVLYLIRRSQRHAGYQDGNDGESTSRPLPPF